MIRNFRDYSANERTFLAWIRTAVAIMGFGFVVGKLELVAAPLGATRQGLIAADHFGQYTGLALILVSLFLILGATVRFLTIRRLLKTSRETTGVSVTIDLLLTALLFLLGVSMVAYLLYPSMH